MLPVSHIIRLEIPRNVPMICVMSFKERNYLHLALVNILIIDKSLIVQNTVLHCILNNHCQLCTSLAHHLPSTYKPLVWSCDHISRSSMCSVIVKELFRVTYRLPSSTQFASSGDTALVKIFSQYALFSGDIVKHWKALTTLTTANKQN